MPEGHVLHRAARLQGKRFNGKRLWAESPQGRFADGAARVDGQVLETIEARGKHLFYRFEQGDVIHVHLGLFGKFQMQTPPFPEPSANARLLLSTESDRVHLAGPTTCALLGPSEVDDVMGRLGPDPILAPRDGADRVAKSLVRRSIPIGAALLDQKVLAGLGNVYRSEFLFMTGIHPFTPAKELAEGEPEALWDLAVAQLKLGERSGRIVTVDPAEVGVAKRSDLTRANGLYAYKRQGERCRRCDDLITSADIDGRNVWWCPTCQPERSG